MKYRMWVKVLLISIILAENERLPTELGWSKATNEISYDDFTDMTKRIQEATEQAQNATTKACVIKHAGRHARHQAAH